MIQKERKHPLQWLRRDIGEHLDRYLARLVFLLGPWLCLWMVEVLNQNDVFQDLDVWQVAMNLIWYYALFFVCRLILGRLRRAAALGAVLSFLVGLLNHYILRFRGRILFPADVAGWRTAANVADGFDYSMDQYIVQAAILLVGYLFLVWMCAPQRKRARLPLAASIPLWAAILGYTYAFFFTGMLPALDIYTQQWVTQRNGFLLNFTVALRYSSVDKPRDYSKQAVLDLMEQYPTVAGDDSVTHPVNLIGIMDESFADFTIFDSFESSEDPTPFLHSLKKNTIKGWMYSPVTGGGTASVEFEYLTGFSTYFQPPHTVAYQLYVDEGMPSLAALAGSQGYETTAFHPYKSSGWNRPLAYHDLDFDDQMYEEDVVNPQYIRHYVSDASDFQMIFQTTQQQMKSFFFNVTMQNHSGYAQGWNNLERNILLPDSLKLADSSAEQYFALARQTDNALRELIGYYSQCDEPTMIVFFGDHQPPLKNAFYERLYGKPLDQRTTEEVMRQYAVPFFIWTNYDLSGAEADMQTEDVVISPNYLGVLTAKLAGLPLTGYMNFLDQMYAELPAITPVGFVTRDGDFLSKKELSDQQQDWLDQYAILNYCGMVDLFDQARPMFCMDEN